MQGILLDISYLKVEVAWVAHVSSHHLLEVSCLPLAKQVWLSHPTLARHPPAEAQVLAGSAEATEGQFVNTVLEEAMTAVAAIYKMASF